MMAVHILLDCPACDIGQDVGSVYDILETKLKNLGITNVNMIVDNKDVYIDVFSFNIMLTSDIVKIVKEVLNTENIKVTRFNRNVDFYYSKDVE